MKMPIIRDAFEFMNIGEGYVLKSDEAEIIESNVLKLKKGEQSSLGLHNDEEEVYVVLSGEGEVRIGDTVQKTKPGTVMYIPRDAEHISTGISEEEYIYLCVAVYLKKAPALQAGDGIK